MTKQEYMDKFNAAWFSGARCGKLKAATEIKDEYISSLEAENAKNGKLLDILLSRLAYFGCPSGDVLLACDKNSEDNACTTCWHEFLMQSDDATQKE